MRKIKHFVIAIVTAYCSCLLPLLVKAQDIHFSQYNFTLINPAMTAAYKDLQATLQHKEQWRMVDAYRTSSATFEMKLSQINWQKVTTNNVTGVFKQKLQKGLAFGINVFNDKAGDGNMKNFQASLSLAYHALINEKNTVSAGLKGGYVQKSISPDGLRWNNQYTGGAYDPTLTPGENFTDQSFGYADFGAGLLWSYGDGSKYLTANDQKHIHAGISIDHLNNPKQSFLAITSDQLHWKITAHAGTLIGVKNTNYSLGASLLYLSQGKLTEITPGALIKYKFKENSVYTGFIKSSALTLGCYYRNKDAVIPYIMYEMDKYSIGISYDTNISGLTAVTTGRGGIEISLRFNAPSPFLYQTKSRI